MDLEVGQICRPYERRQVVDQDIIDHRLAGAALYSVSLYPSGRKRWGVFFVEMLASNAIRIALKRNRSIFDVRQYVGCDPAIEIDYLTLSKAGFGIKYFVNVRKSEFFVADFDGQRSHQEILPRHWADAIAISCKTLLARTEGPALIEGEPFTDRAPYE